MTKLSLCIPTFKSASKLELLLNSIQESENLKFEQIGVCISDNCSTDDTEKVVNKWLKKVPF